MITDQTIFQAAPEPGTGQQPSKSRVKPSTRREPLAFAYFGLILFMIVYFARPEEWIPGLAAVPLAKITGVLIVIAVFFSVGTIRWNLPLEVKLLALLILQLWLSAAFSPVWRGGAANVMLDFSKVLPLVIVIYGAVRSLNRLHWILFLQAGSVAVIAIASIANRHMSHGRLEGVLNGIYGNPNDLALVIDLSLPLCLALALVTKSYWKKLAWTVVMFGMMYAVLLTASRGGAIALCVAALVYLWQFGVKERRFYLLLVIPVAAIVFLVYSGGSLQERFGQTNVDPEANTRDNEAAASAEQRKQLLIQSLKITAQYPLFGVGPGNFTVVSGVWRVTHNSYTQISAEGGIPAFVLYLLILWRTLVNLRAIDKYSKARNEIRAFSTALKASFAAYVVGSFFSSVAYELLPYWLLLYISALSLITKRNRTFSRRVAESKPIPTQVQLPVCQ